MALSIKFGDLAKPYRLRSLIRGHAPWLLINLGLAQKGRDCEAKGAQHEWYNVDNSKSGCYYCQAERLGQLWKADS